MGNIASCLGVSKKAEKDGLDLIQTLFDDMEKRLMAYIKAELSLTRSRGSNNNSGSNTPPPQLIDAPKLIRQVGVYQID